MGLFVSHSSQDKAAIGNLLTALRAADQQVWLDEELGGGEAWWRTILEEIRGCEVFIFALSNNSLASKLCRAELRYAEALQRPILPVQIGPVDSVRVTPIGAMQIIDYRNPKVDTGIQLIEAVHESRGKLPPLPSPLPDEPPVPFAYLMRLGRTLADLELSPHQQAELVSELKAGLDEDGNDPAARRDIARLLSMLRDRPDVTYHTRTDIDAVLKSIDPKLSKPAAEPVTPTVTGTHLGVPPQPTAPPPYMQPEWPPQYTLPATQSSRPPSNAYERRPDFSARGAGAQLSSSVFAPPAAEPGAMFLVQVFAHLPEHEPQVASLARQFDEEARLRSSVELEPRVFEGERIAIELLLPGLLVDDPVQSMVWNGRPQAVQFGVTVPNYFPPRTVIGTVTISRDLVPIGHLKFKVSVHEPGAMPSPVAESEATHGMHRYHRAFISYASADRNEVLKRTQMLADVGIEFFQDLLTLEPGQLWKSHLYHEIDHCDLFLLFWSSAAKKSRWVLKEVNYALERHRGNELALPEILPVIIEGPPPVPPPPELAYLHFNDRMIYFMEPRRKDRWWRLWRRRGVKAK